MVMIAHAELPNLRRRRHQSYRMPRDTAGTHLTDQTKRFMRGSQESDMLIGIFSTRTRAHAHTHTHTHTHTHAHTHTHVYSHALTHRPTWTANVHAVEVNTGRLTNNCVNVVTIRSCQINMSGLSAPSMSLSAPGAPRPSKDRSSGAGNRLLNVRERMTNVVANKPLDRLGVAIKCNNWGI
jgi:hypothetical protein